MNYGKSIWKLRYFWLSLVRVDLRTRYRRSYLGIGWSLLHPLAMTAVICTVFVNLFRLDITEFGPSLLAGFCFWNFLTACTSQGCTCFYQGESYIRQFPAPMAIYPLRVVLGAGFHFLFALSVVVLLRWGLKGFDNLTALTSIIPTLMLLFLFGWAVATIVAFTNVYFPDTQHISEVGLQMLFYMTPIIYPASMLTDRGYGWLIKVNPFANLLELVRTPILAGEIPALSAIVIASATTAGFCGIALFLLFRFERKIIFQL